MIDTPPWWLTVRCECRQKPEPDPALVGSYWACPECSTRYRLMPNRDYHAWVKG